MVSRNPKEGTSGLPEFEKPPVNETIFSVQFAPIPEFGIPHYGLFWNQVKDRYPKFQSLPALPSVQEQFDEPGRALDRLGIQSISLALDPPARCWFLTLHGDRLIQLQRDRLIYNWRQMSGNEPYPRYPRLRQSFEKEWTRFCSFLLAEDLGRPEVNQCEISYVNHIEYGIGWTDFGDLSKVLSFWRGKGTDGFLPAPEGVGIEAHYRLPQSAGRLHLSAQPVIRGRDSKELLQLTITARGAPRSGELNDILAWFDLGREWIVKGFADFTASPLQELWGRKS